MSILIKNIELNETRQDILIQGNSISQIGSEIHFNADKIIDGSNMAVIPGLLNGHNHAAMTLLRGWADDMPLMPWLQEKIWPVENNIIEEDVYWGAKLACLEMIRSGTTTFIDMYHHFQGTARAVEEMGMRGMLTYAGFDFFNPDQSEICKAKVEENFNLMHRYSDRIKYALGPHAIYTVSAPLLKWLRNFANANKVRIHTHLSETMVEYENSLKDFGFSPVQYLNSLGILGNDVSLAHCVHLSDTDIKILTDTGCQVVHNPASNMKLASGNTFRFKDLKNAGIPVALGTDGPSSSNNLDILEAMKLASLTGKIKSDDPTIWNAEETFACAVEHTETITGWKTGKIEVGYLADLCLVNLNLPEMTPNFNLISNLVYSANGSCIDTVICDGKILMEHRHVPGEEEIMKKANEIAHDLVRR
jgi:5-methylthioadenosine/S-adenosylhomocysteine deaminase